MSLHCHCEPGGRGNPSLRAKKIPFVVIASPLGAKQSHKKRLGLPRRYAPRNDILYEIVQPVPSKAKESSIFTRNDILSNAFVLTKA